MKKDCWECKKRKEYIHIDGIKLWCNKYEKEVTFGQLEECKKEKK